MPQCHKCKWNTATVEEKQKHCLTCDFNDCYAKSLHRRGPDGLPRVIELDNPDVHADYHLLQPIDYNDGNDILQELGIAESQIAMIMQFCHAFQSLKLRTRLVALAMMDVGGNNTAIIEACGLPRNTVILKRKELEADPFWAKMLRIARIHQRDTRKSAPRPNKHRIGTKVQNAKKWCGKNRLPPEE